MTRYNNINDVLIELEDYEIKNLIGNGGSGVVFRAIEKKTGKETALKVIEQTTNLRVPPLLNLPGIVKILGFRFPLTKEQIAEKTSKRINLKMTVTDKGRKTEVDLSSAVIVTELMKNGSLDTIVSDYLKTKKCNEKINPTIRSKVIFGVAATMKRVHKNNVIHRDLKLENVFLDDNLEPRIADFGLANAYLGNIGMTMTIRTPYTLAPEIFMDDEDVYCEPVDVYAYAFLLYRMFTNYIEFADGKQIGSSQRYMMKIGRGLRPKKPEECPDVYWELIQDCWRQNPFERLNFDQITEKLKDDKYALEEYGVKTDLDQLHEYRERIDIDDNE
ncbi:hypothetical protein M9Y10_009593 [Tritrichomonas musculus]|uniref:Protein kinase domain-containing protein n=1 Tax=Tritrichomonas musculus TaxID=1915356 RepID=A0ABR2INT2_9EUKA